METLIQYISAHQDTIEYILIAISYVIVFLYRRYFSIQSTSLSTAFRAKSDEVMQRAADTKEKYDAMVKECQEIKKNYDRLQKSVMVLLGLPVELKKEEVKEDDERCS